MDTTTRPITYRTLTKLTPTTLVQKQLTRTRQSRLSWWWDLRVASLTAGATVVALPQIRVLPIPVVAVDCSSSSCQLNSSSNNSNSNSSWLLFKTLILSFHKNGAASLSGLRERRVLFHFIRTSGFISPSFLSKKKFNLPLLS